MNHLPQRYLLIALSILYESYLQYILNNKIINGSINFLKYLFLIITPPIKRKDRFYASHKNKRCLQRISKHF